MRKSLRNRLSWVKAAVPFLDVSVPIIGQLAPKRLASRLKFSSLRDLVGLFLLGLSLSVASAACSPFNSGTSVAPSPTNQVSPPAQESNVKLTLVSFSVTQAAHEKIIPKFAAKWKQEHQQNVTFKQSYGGSGSQALSVIEDQEEADVVHLSLAPDVQKIEKAGLIKPGWEREFPNDGVVSQSVIALVTREGNPKNIKTWNDLTKTGVNVITPNPTTSGLGRWNFLALWNEAIQAGADEEETLEYAAKVYKNAPRLPQTAREATATFFGEQGQGDVLLTYENEVILEALKGKKPPYVIPDVNFLVENPVAVVDENVDKHGTREVAEAFVEYLYTPEAQEEFAKLGYRQMAQGEAPLKELTEQSPKKIKSLATVKDYGGWAKIQKQFFDDDGIVAQILKQINSA